MGISANMCVLILGKENWLTQDQVTELAYKAGTVFGSENFVIRRKDFDYYKDLRAINIATEDDEIFHKFSKDEQVLDVSMWERYYSKSYTRGNAGFLINLAEWLEFHIPKGNVWYGSIESVDGIKPFNAKKRAELKQYWFENGTYPYEVARLGEPPAPVTCNFCNKIMYSTGGVKTFEFMDCLGCGDRVIAQDGEIVKTVYEGTFLENMPKALGL